MDKDAIELCRYSAQEKKQFKNFFKQAPPRKRKRGRPRKKKRGKAKKRNQNIDLSKPAAAPAKASPNLKAILTKSDLTKALAVARTKANTRVNWDSPDNAQFRDRVARSWMQKCDLFRQGETYQGFCSRCGISRSTLTRYMKLLKKNGTHVGKKRGRKPMLSESVMRHIAERSWCNIYVCLLFLNLPSC